MTAPSHLSADEGYGPAEQRVQNLMTRISAIEWFSSAGRSKERESTEQAMWEYTRGFGLEEIQIQWLEKDQLPAFFADRRLESSPLWLQIHEVPLQIRAKAEETGRLFYLSNLADRVPEKLFHLSFDGAFREFGSQGSTIVKWAVGAVMYVVGLACAWEMLADQDGWHNNPYEVYLQVFGAGHWPLGLFDGVFYAI